MLFLGLFPNLSTPPPKKCPFCLKCTFFGNREEYLFRKCSFCGRFIFKVEGLLFFESRVLRGFEIPSTCRSSVERFLFKPLVPFLLFFTAPLPTEARRVYATAKLVRCQHYSGPVEHYNEKDKTFFFFFLRQPSRRIHCLTNIFWLRSLKMVIWA